MKLEPDHMLILFIDDDADDYDVFREALKIIDDRAKCLHAVSGEDALDLLKNILLVLPDLIFLDVNMPTMGGKECLRKIKEVERLKDIPVIMYSTTANPREIDIFYAMGAVKFIIKPVTFGELTWKIKDVIKSA